MHRPCSGGGSCTRNVGTWQVSKLCLELHRIPSRAARLGKRATPPVLGVASGLTYRNARSVDRKAGSPLATLTQVRPLSPPLVGDAGAGSSVPSSASARGARHARKRTAATVVMTTTTATRATLRRITVCCPGSTGAARQRSGTAALSAT